MALICRPEAPGQAFLGLFGCVPPPVAETAVAFISTISVVAAASFGLMALFTTYKDKEGRTTFFGRMAAAGVVVTALLSLTLSRLTSEIDSLKGDAARKLQDQRFNDQLRRFGLVQTAQDQALRQGERVREGMAQSLAGQQLQLAAARQTSRDLALTAQDSQDNAARLMRSVWEGANGVSTRDLRMRISTECSFVRDDPRAEALLGLSRAGRPLPTAFEPEAQLSLQVYGADVGPAPEIAVIEPGRGMTTGATGPEQAYLAAGTFAHSIVAQPRVKIGSRTRSAPEHVSLVQTTEFSDFTQRSSIDPTSFRQGLDLGLKSSWRGLVVESRLESPPAPFLALFDNAPSEREEAVQPPYNVTGILGQTAHMMRSRLPHMGSIGTQDVVMLAPDEHLLPCEADLELLLGDEVVAHSEGRLFRIDNSTFYGLGLATRPLRIEPTAFARLTPPPALPRRGRQRVQ